MRAAPNRAAAVRSAHYDDNHTLVIPVVFHVIKRTDGTGDISPALIQSQIDILNEDFNAVPNTPGVMGTNAKIQFVLAKLDPTGNPTTGINVVTSNTYFEDPGSSGQNTMKRALATNVCLNRLRSRKRRAEDSDSTLLVEIAARTDPQARSAARSVLDALFRQEPEDTALIAVLHLHDRMTLEEVAAEVGMSVSGVRKRLAKLRAKLHHLKEVPSRRLFLTGSSSGPPLTKFHRRAAIESL